MSRIKELYDNSILSLDECNGKIQVMEACDYYYKLEWSKAEAQEFINELQLMVDKL